MFVILLVAGILVGHVFYNIFYGTRYRAQVFQTRTIDVIRNLMESFKNYLKLSLTYSSHQSLREHARLGGLKGSGAWGESGPWICNGPNPVSVEESKSCLEEYTKYYLNVYTELFDTQIPVRLSKKNSSECVYGVDESGVLSGEYDEGNFWVNCSGSGIAISSKDMNEFESVSIDDFMTRNRYWYMFRVFHEWAMDDVFSPCVCSCAASCRSCDCVRDCAEKALDDLERRFRETDEFVTCEMSKICCAEGVGGVSCSPRKVCFPWEGNEECMFTPCEHECKLHSSSTSESSFRPEHPTGVESSTLSLTSDATSCKCKVWYEKRLGAIYSYRCVDQKYYVPSRDGPVPLEFSVRAQAFWRAPDACPREIGCISCPHEENCTDCVCPPCPDNPCFFGVTRISPTTIPPTTTTILTTVPTTILE